MSTDGELPLVRRNGKSEAAFRTISEVAEDLDVPQHVLRFWESKFPQVKPLKRGGGRRYYRPEDVVLLRRIRDLLYSEGYTIKGVQKLLREGGHKEPAPAVSPAKEPELMLSETPQIDRRLELPEGEGEGEGEAPSFGDDDASSPSLDASDMGDSAEMTEIVEAEIEEDEAEENIPASIQSPEPIGFSPQIRESLTALLDELEQMRSLLHSALR